MHLMQCTELRELTGDDSCVCKDGYEEVEGECIDIAYQGID